MTEKLTDREVSNLEEVSRMMLTDMFQAVLTEDLQGREGGKPPIAVEDAETLGDIYQEFYEVLKELTKNRTL